MLSQNLGMMHILIMTRLKFVKFWKLVLNVVNYVSSKFCGSTILRNCIDTAEVP